MSKRGRNQKQTRKTLEVDMIEMGPQMTMQNVTRGMDSFLPLESLTNQSAQLYPLPVSSTTTEINPYLNTTSQACSNLLDDVFRNDELINHARPTFNVNINIAQHNNYPQESNSKSMNEIHHREADGPPPEYKPLKAAMPGPSHLYTNPNPPKIEVGSYNDPDKSVHNKAFGHRSGPYDRFKDNSGKINVALIDDNTEKQRVLEKRRKNRRAAARSRTKKKERIDELESEKNSLERELWEYNNEIEILTRKRNNLRIAAEEHHRICEYLNRN